MTTLSRANVLAIVLVGGAIGAGAPGCGCGREPTEAELVEQYARRGGITEAEMMDLVRRRTQREQGEKGSLADLQRRIIAYVDGLPGKPAATLDDLRKAGAVTAADVTMLKKLPAVFHPVHAGSDPLAVILVHSRDENHREYFFKNGQAARVTYWEASPGGLWEYEEWPQEGGKGRLSIVREATGGPVIAKFPSEEISVGRQRWSPDGAYLSINDAKSVRLWRVRKEGLVECSLPEEITTARQLEQVDVDREGTWQRGDLRADEWRGPRTLYVTSLAGRDFKDGGRASVKNGYELEVAEDGKVTIGKREPGFYERREPRKKGDVQQPTKQPTKRTK